MKWVFYLLLLANVAYFGWQARGLPPAAESPSHAVASSLDGSFNRLLLLSEIEPGELRARTAFSHRDEGPSTAQSPNPDPPAVQSQNGGKDSSKDDARTCYRLGPVSKKARWDAIRAWLDARDITVASESGQRREVPLHWVYLRPLPTRAAAKKQARRMKKNGIRDIYILPRGNMRYAISLGVFRKRASMKKRLDELKEKGYAPAVGSRYRTEKTVVFNVVLPAGAAFPRADFAGKFPSSAVTATDCGPLPGRSTAWGPVGSGCGISWVSRGEIVACPG